MMKIHNYTPHAVTLFDEDGDPLVTFAPVGLSRAKQNAVTVCEIDLGNGVAPVKKMTFGAVEGLPETCANDERFIVSAITAQAAKETRHPIADKLLVVADPVRNADGQIIGCRSFSTLFDAEDDDGRAHDEFGNIDW